VTPPAGAGTMEHVPTDMLSGAGTIGHVLTDSPRIVDLVFQGKPPRGRRGLGALLFAAALHAALGLWLLDQRSTLEGWSAEVAARVHEELNRVEIVELPPPEPPPEPPPPSEPAPPLEATPPPTPPASTPRAPRTRLKVGNPPAQAGKVLAAPPGALDLTGDIFVQGKGDAYAGGATSPGGTGQRPVARAGTPPPQPAKPSRPSRAAPVSLRSGQWNCPWPDAAADLPLDEQTATIRVTVRADGSVETSNIVEDPGDGFGPAALRCARATRFTPATDADGRPIRAVSPPIRVHFYR